MAQNHRHRSEHSFIYLLDDFEFYTPEILEDNETLKEQWAKDMQSVADMYPQGTLIKIVQTGNLDTLVLKARERAITTLLKLTRIMFPTPSKQSRFTA